MNRGQRSPWANSWASSRRFPDRLSGDRQTGSGRSWSGPHRWCSRGTRCAGGPRAGSRAGPGPASPDPACRGPGRRGRPGPGAASCRSGPRPVRSARARSTGPAGGAGPARVAAGHQTQAWLASRAGPGRSTLRHRCPRALRRAWTMAWPSRMTLGPLRAPLHPERRAGPRAGIWGLGAAGASVRGGRARGTAPEAAAPGPLRRAGRPETGTPAGPCFSRVSCETSVGGAMGSGPVTGPLRPPDRDAARAAGGPPGTAGRRACGPPEPGAAVAGPRST